MLTIAPFSFHELKPAGRRSGHSDRHPFACHSTSGNYAVLRGISRNSDGMHPLRQPTRRNPLYRTRQILAALHCGQLCPFLCRLCVCTGNIRFDSADLRLYTHCHTSESAASMVPTACIMASVTCSMVAAPTSAAV